MFQKQIYIIILFFVSLHSYSATITAKAGGGAWNNTATWDCTCIPGSGDNVIIPLGITVTSPSSLSSINSITINGTLSITGDLTFGNSAATNVYNYGTLNVSGKINFNNGWGGGDVLTVETGAVVNLTGNLEFNNSSTGNFVVLSGGSAYITGAVNSPLTNPQNITNS